MLKKLSIQWRLTILSAILLTVCCVGLTIILNLTAFQLADEIDATLITMPATQGSQLPNNEQLIQDLVPSLPSEELQDAKRGFSSQSIFYMLIIIFSGSTLTYYLSKKALKPLDYLNEQVKNITIHNLSETLPVPPTSDEISELTQSFNDMTDKLNKTFLTQKNFSASAAHELRTPLAVLQTKVDVFKKKSVHTNEEYEALLTVFEKQVIRLRNLVSNLLDMTNLQDEREQSQICLQDVFKDIICELSTVAKEKKVSLLLNCDNSLVFGNLDLLYRAFYNLVENGIKYNIYGGTVQIDIVKVANEKIEILINDTGIGIPKEMKKHIFEPFYRVDKSRSRELGGAGLGLSIVDIIIKNHNGTIAVLDNKSGGTCFKIIL